MDKFINHMRSLGAQSIQKTDPKAPHAKLEVAESIDPFSLVSSFERGHHDKSTITDEDIGMPDEEVVAAELDQDIETALSPEEERLSLEPITRSQDGVGRLNAASAGEKQKSSVLLVDGKALQLTASKIEDARKILKEATGPATLENLTRPWRQLGEQASQFFSGRRQPQAGKQNLERSFNDEELMFEMFPPVIAFDEIRLVVLEPSEHTNSVPVCTLKAAKLNSRPAFEALSWAWGERWQDAQVPIYFQQREWYVPQNLYAALTCLRRPATARTLWIDALCINQGASDLALEERAQQIRLMRHIYTFANHVVIWLGQPQAHLSAFLRATLENGDFVSASEVNVEATYTVLNQILENAWFSRLWTLQEAALPEMASVQFGELAFRFDDFLSNLRHLENNLQYELRQAAERLKMNIHRSVKLCTMMKQYVAKSGILDSARVLPAQQDTKQQASRDIRQQLHLFHSILSNARHQLTSDPRDKIYGLLGLVEDSVPSLVAPSYLEPLVYTFTRTCGLLAYNTQSLEIISSAAKKTRKPSKLALPSWVPDWSQEFSNHEIACESQLEMIIRELVLPKTAPSSARSISFDGISILETRGLKVDRIKIVGERLPRLNNASMIRWALPPFWVGRLYYLQGKDSKGESLTKTGPSWERFHQKRLHYDLRQAQRELGDQLLEVESFSARPPLVDTLIAVSNYVARPTYDEAARDPSTGFREGCDWTRNMRYVTGGSFYNAFWKMICHGVDPVSSPSAPRVCATWDMLGALQTFEFPEAAEFPDAADTPHIERHIRATLSHRCFFVTDDGFLGNTSDAAVGDMVFTLRGARLPVVLRPVQSPGQVFKLVSECYVPGIETHDRHVTLASQGRRQWLRKSVADVGTDVTQLLNWPLDFDFEETVLLE